METMLSFIIPALNEANNILSTLQSIVQLNTTGLSYEILLIDNGSTDETVSIAKSYGVRTFVYPRATIAALRNFGARMAKGSVLVFLDGDVLLTAEWFANIQDTLLSLNNHPMTITGSRCAIREMPSWIERFWFAPLSMINTNYINSGHLVIAKCFFDRLGGFNEELATGEDYELGMRCKVIKGLITNNPRLRAVHVGYPQNLLEFVKRERWHSKSSFRTVQSILRSRTSILTLLFLLLHSLLLIAALFNGIKYLGIVAVLSIFLICIVSAFVKYRKPLKIVIINAYLYYFYYAGRSLSLLERLFPRPGSS